MIPVLLVAFLIALATHHLALAAILGAGSFVAVAVREWLGPESWRGLVALAVTAAVALALAWLVAGGAA